jgi:hypothetical protein
MTEPLNEPPEFEEGLWPSRLTSAEMFGRLRESFDFYQEYIQHWLPQPGDVEGLSRDTIKIPRRVEPLSSADLADITRCSQITRLSEREWQGSSYFPGRVDRPLQMWAPIGNPLGDSTCANNANSIHLRCAVNPCGPCEGCKDYIGVGGAGGAL